MWFVRIEETFQPVLGCWRHALETGMVRPVLGCIFNKRKVLEAVTTDAFIHVE